MFKSKPNLNDAYFIFADDVLVDRIPYEKFKNLIKFYALLYDRIIIPDSFVINNKNLHRFFLEEQGYDYLTEGVIVFTMREEVKDIQDLLYAYRESKTLNNNIKEDTIKQILEYYNFRNTLKWKLSNVSSNFAKHILNSQNTINLKDEERESWKDIILNLNEKKNLTRQQIYNHANERFGINNDNAKLIMQHADIVYNFNLPNMFMISAAYPERLLSNKALSPEKVFFYRETSKGPVLQPEDLFSKDDLILDEPLIFYTAIINQLKFNNIIEIRKTKQFKNYLKSIIENNPSKMVNAFYDYCKTCNQMIPNMISVDYQEIKELHTKIHMFESGKKVASKVTSIMLGVVPLGNVVSTAAEFLISKGIQFTSKTLADRVTCDYESRSINANRSVKRTIKDSPFTVLDDMNEVFQINKLK
ncbi:hypothetical protein NBE98_09580 [Clostridium swellfunianum]|uniref:hypothetical protein n=1 Tax=Clostridium swellfunianum TaxID=1367462 RepID=UPI00202F22C9|nr:hypothetical protein [Clostridium swellfunianum]MCM0648623.1 hypothetical protein [Clostridium swellfunianum]